MAKILKVIAVLIALGGGTLTAIWYIVNIPVWAEKNTRGPISDPNRLRAHVIALSEAIGGRPHNLPDRLDDAADYIFEQFAAFGEPQFQTYDVRGQTYKNVVLRIHGNQYCEDHLVVVGAHYDTEGDKPGADDNASGVAGLIELANTIHRHPLPCAVELVAYSLEEPPYFRTPNMGSHHHAQSIKTWPRVTMISLEMIGFYSDAPDSQHFPVPAMKYVYGDRGDFIGIVGDLESRALIADVKRSFIQTNRIKTKAISAPSFIAGIDFSDHQNYRKIDFPAIMITDTAFYRNPHYHRQTDTHDTLDFEKMSAVVDSTYFALKDIIG